MFSRSRSRMRAVLGATLVSALSSACATGYRVEPLTPGDTFSYGRCSGVPNTLTYTAVRSDADGTMFARHSALGLGFRQVDAAGNFLAGSVSASEMLPIQHLSAPLMPDLRESVMVATRNDDYRIRLDDGRTERYAATWHLLGLKNLRVPSGSFDTLWTLTTLEKKPTSPDMPSFAITRVEWLAPSLRMQPIRAVEYVRVGNHSYTVCTELTAYRVAPVKKRRR